MLEIKKLTKYYGDILGVKDLSLHVNKGEIFGFIGPNGAGKSTTIRCILNLINKNSGEIKIDGNIIEKDSYKYKEDIGYLPSEIHLYDDLTVWQTILYSESFYKKDFKKRAKQLLKRLELSPTKKVDELSLGNLKKLGIVLALMHEPKLLILDEASSGLDPLMQEEFYKILLEEKERGTTIFFSSHILSEIKKICDRVGIIKEGHLIKVENIKDISMNNSQIVTVYTKDKIKNIQILESSKEYVKFMYNKSPKELMQLLSNYNIEKLLVEEPSIEELFMHYYK